MSDLKSISPENSVYTFKTIQTGPFRTSMTAIKEILFETNWILQPDGIRIINMDKTHTIIVHMFLEAENFEFYECKKEKIIIGVNMIHFFKIINTIDAEDILTVYIANEDYCDGVVSKLTFKFENGAIKQCKTMKFKLIEPEQDELAVPDVKFSSVINLPSSDFQKIVRDAAILSEKLEIKSVGGELLFCYRGAYADVELCRGEADGSMEFVSKPDAYKIIQGEFSLKTLKDFIKCTGLCQHIELHFENDLPLVIKYKVASLGEIQLGLVPLLNID